MAAYDVNGRCEDCTFADAFGRSCQHGMLFPVMVLIEFGDLYQCPNFQKKNAEQLQEQIRLKNNENKYDMDFKKLKLLTELIDQYEWQMGHGLAVWIEYSNCTTVFDKILEIDTERFPNCLAERTGIYIDHFEDILSFYTNDIEKLFPKDED
jgi:hypothetical protein